VYESYWSFQRKPFGGGCDLRAYYPGEAHQGALLKLRYAVESRCGAALLAGPNGVGKTLVARLLAERLPEEAGPTIHLTFPQMPTTELLAYLAEELGADLGPDRREVTLDLSVRAVEKKLRENAAAGRHALLIVDEAHLLEGTRTFEALRLLLNVEHEGRPAATLVFVGQTSLLPTISRLPQLEQRLGVKCLLRALTRDETHAYVQHRMQTVGGRDDVFDGDALDAVHAISQGTPRDINRLCDLALLLGFADGAQRIDAERIEAVARELVEIAAD
jgi:type II secretory pathway predicted ATPase ExeA